MNKIFVNKEVWDVMERQEQVMGITNNREKGGGRKMQKALTTIGVALLLFGCQGPQIQKAILGLSADTDSVAVKIAAAEPILGGIAGIDMRAAEPKLSKEAKDSLLAKIGETQALIAATMGIRTNLTVIKDSLTVLEEKAKGKAKEDATALSTKLDEVAAKLMGFAEGGRKLEEIKVKLQKVEEKPVKGKKGTKTVAPKGKKAIVPEKR
ncbi:MAG: hypothetical protein HY769_03750 [Candidatus Stahlbacteria bacterium]|nr:hypothetical protein [Candidatus Stahlbacteria bacterium]